MDLYKQAEITCDYNEDGKTCTRSEEYRELANDSTDEEFKQHALSYFKGMGWRVDTICYCPAHWSK